MPLQYKTTTRIAERGDSTLPRITTNASRGMEDRGFPPPTNKPIDPRKVQVTIAVKLICLMEIIVVCSCFQRAGMRLDFHLWSEPSVEPSTVPVFSTSAEKQGLEQRPTHLPSYSSSDSQNYVCDHKIVRHACQ